MLRHCSLIPYTYSCCPDYCVKCSDNWWTMNRKGCAGVSWRDKKDWDNAQQTSNQSNWYPGRGVKCLPSEHQDCTTANTINEYFLQRQVKLHLYDTRNINPNNIQHMEATSVCFTWKAAHLYTYKNEFGSSVGCLVVPCISHRNAGESRAPVTNCQCQGLSDVLSHYKATLKAEVWA